MVSLQAIGLLVELGVAGERAPLDRALVAIAAVALPAVIAVFFLFRLFTALLALITALLLLLLHRCWAAFLLHL